MILEAMIEVPDRITERALWKSERHRIYAAVAANPKGITAPEVCDILGLDDTKDTTSRLRIMTNNGWVRRCLTKQKCRITRARCWVYRPNFDVEKPWSENHE